jgi:hypothetical protein
MEEMGTCLSHRSFRILGLFILLNLGWLTADWMKAEGGGVSGHIPAEAKFSCAIAKSAYGLPAFDEPIRRLHHFRDRVLMGSAVGRWVAGGYYRLSASLAPCLGGDGPAGAAVRGAIRGFLYVVKYLEAVLGIGALLIAFMLTTLMCRLRVRRHE